MASLDERISILAAALSDEKASVAWNAAKELGKLGTAAQSALPQLSAALRSPDATTALWARYAVARITGDLKKHLPALIAALDDRRVYPGMAGTALAAFGRDSRAAIPRLRELLAPGNHADNRWAAAFALAHIGEDSESAVPSLGEMLSDADEKLRWYAAYALCMIGPASVPALAELIGRLEDFDDDVRYYSVKALGRIGPSAREAIPRLRSLMEEDENENIRAEAAAAAALIDSSPAKDEPLSGAKKTDN